MIGNAFINTPYIINAMQPHVLSHLNLRSLFTSNEMASNTEAIYPTVKIIVSVILYWQLYCFLVLSKLMTAGMASAVLVSTTGLVASVVLAGAEFRDAPTAISHLWPGCP